MYNGAVLKTTDGAGNILVGMAFNGKPVYPTGLEIVPGMEFKSESLPRLLKKINLKGQNLIRESEGRLIEYIPMFSPDLLKSK